MAWHNDQVSEKETEEILRLAREQVFCEGDFVEMGCYRGDTSLLLAETLSRGAELCQEMRCSLAVPKSTAQSAAPLSSFSIHDKSVSDGYSAAPASLPSIHAETTSNAHSSFGVHDKGVSDGCFTTPVSSNTHAETTSGVLLSNVGDDREEKRLWIYDSFEGLPEKSGADESAAGRDFKGGELAVTKREVKERFLRAGLKVPVIKKAWFSELTEVDLPEKIAFAFLDGDFYESIRDSLKLVWGKMAPGGVVVIHDYMNPALPGVAKAVDEWCAAKGVTGSVIQSMFVVRM
ncbi:class I SAM-dependent methyltransferase [Candidatus Saccharibacteria bacterium]|nr:class I SAM-dependent methyltransferase [Candidatus Saccharibacteria bacterium]